MADNQSPGLWEARYNPNSNSVIIKGNFNYPGFNMEKYVGKRFKDGNFQMPGEMLQAARIAAKKLMADAVRHKIDLNQSLEWKDAGRLLTMGGMTVDALAAYMLAKSMGANMEVSAAEGASHLTVVFDNRLELNDYKADPAVVFETARQILGDNNIPNVAGPATNTAASDALYVGKNVSKVEVTIARSTGDKPPS